MHLSEEQVAAFVSGALPPAETHALELHLEECDACLRLVGLSARTALREPQEQAPRQQAHSRYLVLEELGSGAMGTVYAAYDTQLDRRIALKRIKGAPTEARRKRLQREAQVMARLEHPHIAALYDIGVDAEGDYIAMQLVDGGSLRQWLQEKPRSSDEVLQVFLAAGEGLAAAHAAGVTHRDFKPENVLIGRDGRVRVTDFGLARSVTPEDARADRPSDAHSPPSPKELGVESLTRSGTLIGTPLYMSPEQLQGSADTDGRSDQFSYCVALFEALTGERPFEGRTLEELQRAVASGALFSRAQRRRAPSRVGKVLLRGLAPRPEERFPSMEALVATLKRARTARRRLARTLAAAAVVGVLATAAVAVKRVPMERCAAPPPRWASLWNAAARTEASAAFQKSGLPFAGTAFRTVDEALGRFLVSWSEQRREACAQTHWHGTQPEALLKRQLACLDRRLLEAQALATLLRAADEGVVSKAPQAVGSLLTLSACQDPPAWMALRQDATAAPSPARLAHAERIAELRVLRKAGSAPVLLEKARTLHQAYQEDPTLEGSVERAEALDLLADAHLFAGQVNESRARYVEAIQAAELAGAEDLRAGAELSLGWVHFVAADLKAGHESLGRAVALLKRIPESAALRQQRLRLQSLAANLAGRHEEAVRFAGERAELAAQEHGPGSLSTALVRADLGMALAYGGHLDEARAHLLEMVATTEKELGPAHPMLGVHLRKLAEVELHLGRNADALAHAERAVGILEPGLGTGHLEVGIAQAFVATAHAQLEHPPAIVAPAFVRARDLMERAYGPVHPNVASVWAEEARYWAVQGEATRAEALFERACAMYGEELMPYAVGVADCWAQHGLSELDLGRPQKARPLLLKARAHYVAAGKLQSLEGLQVRASLALWNAGAGAADEAARELEQVLRELDALPSQPAWQRATYQLYLAETLAGSGAEERARVLQLAGEAERVLREQGRLTLARRAERLRTGLHASAQ